MKTGILSVLIVGVGLMGCSYDQEEIPEFSKKEKVCLRCSHIGFTGCVGDKRSDGSTITLADLEASKDSYSSILSCGIGKTKNY